MVKNKRRELEKKLKETIEIEEKQLIQQRLEQLSKKNRVNQYDSLVWDDGLFYVDNGMILFDEGTKNRKPIEVCTAVQILEHARTEDSSEWGRFLIWQDKDGQQHHWIVSMSMLQGDSITEVRKYLSSHGVTFGVSKKLNLYLQTIFSRWPASEKRVKITKALGWDGGKYLMPNECISSGNEDEFLFFQNQHAVKPPFSVSGTSQEWKTQVARLAVGNSRLVFAISVAFASTLVELSGQDNGGFHLRGASSTGKTTGLRVASSVFGRPDGYIRTWRSTSNGLESVAAIHNDTLLVLDELSMCEPKTASESAYLLSGGQGKNRAKQYGEAKENQFWRLLFLSSGEVSLPTLTGRRTNAGEEIRFADIEADAGSGYGLFENLHEFDSPVSFSVALKDASAQFYGQIFIDWIKEIVKNRIALARTIHDGVHSFMNKVVPANKQKNGQISRMARRFGLVAIAGEIATDYGLTGWKSGEATEATKKCFFSWLDSFGEGSKEDKDIIDHTRQFFLAHGASRFQSKELPDNGSDYKIVNRVGFYGDEEEGKRKYFIPDAGMREIYKGFDLKQVKRVLIEQNIILPGEKLITQQIRIPSEKLNSKFYVFDYQAMDIEVEN